MRLPMHRRTVENAHIVATWLLVSMCGAIEGLYGRVRYSGDAICYLNVARAVAHADWRAAFDPMWTIGYPALVAAVKTLAPATPEGEWYAITVLNWLVFLGNYACFRWLLHEEGVAFGPPYPARIIDPWVTWLACLAFLACEICFSASVSRVTPDLLVSGLLLAATAQTLRVIRRATAGDAIGLGAILGVGCWVKGVFFSYSAIFVFVVALAAVFRRPPAAWARAGIMAATLGVIAIPYVALLSWAYGAFTLGVTGELNYAFHVNHLPHWSHWTGDAEFGAPIHPSGPIVSGLPVFAFAEPFSTTYSPYNNIAYWYRGFRHVFGLHNQLAALGHTGFTFLLIVCTHPFLKCFVAATTCLIIFPAWRDAGRAAVRTVWPAVLAAVLAMLPFLAVHIEDRYLGIPFLILSTVPVLCLLNESLPRRRLFLAGLATFYVLGAAWEMYDYSRGSLISALRRVDFHDDRDWRVAAALPRYGLKPGDGVALVPEDDYTSRCTWAYLSQLRIIAEFGATPWRIHPTDRIWLDGDRGEPADANAGLLFWALPIERRTEVLAAFRRVGARAVVSLTPPSEVDPGWLPIENTGVWILQFPDAATGLNDRK
jgi:hypothetical protein